MAARAKPSPSARVSPVRPAIPGVFMLRLSPALLLAVPALAVAQPAPDWSKGTPITITVTNKGFTPARIDLRSGRGYVLRIRNVSDRRHNLSSPEFFTAARVAPGDSGWVTDDKVDLKAGQSARIRIVAPATRNAIYPFRSTNLLDAAAGMKGAFRVR
ncbi:MAG: cupredoxin domain-containing protein [Sphingomonas sp.]